MPASILIADDDAVMLGLYSRMFAGKGYSISMAASFTEASGLLGSKDYDLLITDFMFNDGVGTELIRLFHEKKRKAKAAARSVMVTGYPAAPGRARCPDVSAYFEKPFKIEDLLKTVRDVLAG